MTVLVQVSWDRDSSTATSEERLRCLVVASAGDLQDTGTVEGRYQVFLDLLDEEERRFREEVVSSERVRRLEKESRLVGSG